MKKLGWTVLAMIFFTILLYINVFAASPYWFYISNFFFLLIFGLMFIFTIVIAIKDAFGKKIKEAMIFLLLALISFALTYISSRLGFLGATV